MAAFDQMWGSAEIQNIASPGQFIYTLVEILLQDTGSMPGTHFITFVADSRGKLMEAVTKMQASTQMAAYLAQIGDARELEQISMTIEAKRWAN